MRFSRLEHRLWEDILLEKEYSADIAADVTRLLAELTSRDIFVVCRLARYT